MREHHRRHVVAACFYDRRSRPRRLVIGAEYASNFTRAEAAGMRRYSRQLGAGRYA